MSKKKRKQMKPKNQRKRQLKNEKKNQKKKYTKISDQNYNNHEIIIGHKLKCINGQTFKNFRNQIMKNFNIFPVLTAIYFFCFTPVQAEIPRYYLPVTVNKTTVKTTNTPCALDIDFQDLLADLNIAGKFDRFSVVIEGKDPLSGEFIPVDCRVGEHYEYSTAGTVYWLIENPKMTEFRIWFDTVTDPPRKPRSVMLIIESLKRQIGREGSVSDFFD